MVMRSRGNLVSILGAVIVVANLPGLLGRDGPRTGTRVLDLACGKGEMLCRWAQDFGSRGLGVDISEVFVTAARSRAEKLGVTDRVVIGTADGRLNTTA